ncbi:hypothetical protein OC861_004092 [Tilletia horrida]|nr:hypothetical protein OC861_004092 [Tilletia horrida]
MNAQEQAQQSTPPTSELPDPKAFYDICLESFRQSSSRHGTGPDPSVDAVLSKVSQERKEAYLQTQRRARATYHAEAERERRQTLSLLLAGCPPHSALFPDRARPPTNDDLMTKTTRHRRRKRFADFVGRHCKQGNVGLLPFFKGLYTLLWLQSSARAPRHKHFVLGWQLDDAVLLEGGDDVFRSDAVVTLKGVLGFSESISSSTEAAVDGCGERLWTISPVLTDPELAKLRGLIPNFATVAQPPRPGVEHQQIKLSTGYAVVTDIERVAG